MDVDAVAAWVGLEPTPERLARLASAIPIVIEAVEVIRAVDGLPDGGPAVASRDVPLRYEAPTIGGTATDPCDLDMIEAACSIRRGDLSPGELLASCLAAIERTDPVIGAFVRLDPDVQPGCAGPLRGIPFAAKDVLDTANLATECGSDVFAGRMPRRDATVVSRMKAAGGVLVGKTATHEIAYGVSTPQVRNPWNPDRMCSGSSGGSAAALAARQVPAALGTDTGGSLRLPSAFCGTTAIKPTHGLVPGSGAMTLAPSFDVVGPMARTAQDCWLLLRILIDAALPEPVTVAVDVPPSSGVGSALVRDVRIGVADAVTPDQETVANTMRELGAELVDVRLPPLEVTRAAATVLAFAEASSEFRHHVVRGARLADDILSLLEAGLTVPVADFVHAGRVRARIRQEYGELFGEVDLILLPTSPITDLPHGITEWDGVPLIPLLTPFTLPASVAGLPAIAFPCGFTASGMPIGAQLVGPASSESLLAAVAGAYQRATDWHTRKPTGRPREPT